MKKEVEKLSKKTVKEKAPEVKPEEKDAPSETPAPDAPQKSKNTITAKTIILGFVGLILVFLATFAILIYGTKNESPVVKSVVKVVPYPAVIVNGKVILMSDYYEQLDILKNYYASEIKKVDFNSDEGKKQLAEIRKDVMSRLKEDAIVAIEAKKAGVTVSKEDLEKSFNELVKSNGGTKGFSDILNKFYGLTPEQFKIIIYKPRVLREKLAEKINSEESVTGAAKQKADEVYTKVKAGEDFASLAKQFSQDPGSAANGGDLGFFGKGKMVPEFEEVVFKLKRGETSEPTRTVYGYHIIRVTDTKGDEVRASHILIKVRDFNEWLEEKKKNYEESKTWGFLPGIVILYKTN